MWKFLGFEYFDLSEKCLISTAPVNYDLLPEFLGWSLAFTASLYLFKMITDKVYNSMAIAYAMNENGLAEPKADNARFREDVKKFREESWKWMVTLFLTLFGLWVVFSERDQYDITQWYTRYPQYSTARMTWYYRLSLGYHLHRTFAQFVEARRKDFIALTVHHWTTILLILISLTCYVMEAGVLVMVIHDNTDFFLAMAKFLNYQRIRIVKDVFFALFVLSWIFGRCVTYSYLVLYPILKAKEYSCHILYYVVSFSLFILLFLHLYWLRMIFPMFISVFVNKREIVDTRSDREFKSGKRKSTKGE